MNPLPGTKPSRFSAKSGNRYPRPSWCLIPFHDGTHDFALPIPKLQPPASANTTLPGDPPPLPREPEASWGQASNNQFGWGWGETSWQTLTSDSSDNHLPLRRPLNDEPDAVKSNTREQPSAPSPGEIRIKDEFIEPSLPLLSQADATPAVKAEPMDEDVEVTASDLPLEIDLVQTFYLVLFNPIGFNKRNPSDLTQVKAWLESSQLFGANTVHGFWIRCLVGCR